MKTKQSQHQSRNQGSVLVIAMSILAVAAVLLASYLTLVQTQTNAVSRSQTWNSAIAVTEAGIEEALAEINKGSPNGIDTHPYDWTNSVTSDGWSAYTNGVTSITRVLSTSGAGTNQFTVSIDISAMASGGTPVVTSAGKVAFTSVRWGSTSLNVPQPFLAQIGTSSGASSFNVGRKVQVQTVLSPLFTVAMLSRSNIDMHGNNVTVDSFDSRSPLYSSNGQWVASMRKANGSIATDSSVIGDISIGQGNIYGHVYTGPGTVQADVQIGNNGAVGDLAWQALGKGGIESNYWAGNFNTAIPDVIAPNFAGQALPAPQTNGQAYPGSIVLNGGNYTVASVQNKNSTFGSSSSQPIVITAPTVLWVQSGNVALLAQNLVFTNTGSLVLYVGTATGSGDTLSLAGTGTINQPGLAANLQIFGLPSLTSITLQGNAGFIGTIYAPEASFTGGGGGSNPLDSSGAIVVNNVTVNGHWNFHYDEALATSGAARGWIAKSWTEQKY